MPLIDFNARGLTENKSPTEKIKINNKGNSLNKKIHLHFMAIITKLRGLDFS